MNMQSIVGHKDVFLSYAHININFARKIKVFSACGEGYTTFYDKIYFYRLY